MTALSECNRAGLDARRMLNFLGWMEAATLIEKALEKTIAQKKVTYDLARQMQGAKELKTSAFADAIIKNM